MKKILFLILFLFFFTPLQTRADMLLEGGVKYNVETARDELTRYQYPVPSDLTIRNNYIDAHFKENVAALLEGKAQLKDRELAFFSDGIYGVIYKKNPLEVFYYQPNGQLLFIELRSRKEYPFKSYKYDMSKQLVNMGLRVSKGETFIYTPQGVLIAHWVNQYGYDTQGKVIMTRKYVE